MKDWNVTGVTDAIMDAHGVACGYVDRMNRLLMVLLALDAKDVKLARKRVIDCLEYLGNKREGFEASVGD